MTTDNLCKNLFGCFESCKSCQHDSESECGKLINHTFSFDVKCNGFGVKEIKKAFLSFLQSKNWCSKNISVSSEVSNEVVKHFIYNHK